MTRPLSARIRPFSALRAFLRIEASGGIILIGAAALAILVANSPAAPAYFEGLDAHLGPLSVLHWINDGAMALFFLLVGLEIKREFVDGSLSRWSDRGLPLVAAAAGMALPALLYLLGTAGAPALARGWAIPAATDIAFAMAVLALAGPRVPASLKLLLVTVAIVDDVGAIAIIGLAYSSGLNGAALAASAAAFAGLLALNRAGVRSLPPYLGLALLLWGAVWLSGIHATLAGVLAAFAIPLERSPGTPDATASPLHRLEHGLHPWVAYAVLPAFGFANAGVPLAGALGAAISPLPASIAAALFLGKQAAVFGTVRLAALFGLVGRPAGATWLQVYGAALLCGIGFTMSLFIGGLALPRAHMDAVRIGVLAGSLTSAAFGLLVLRFAPPLHRARG